MNYFPSIGRHLNPRVILFGLVLFHFVSEMAQVLRFQRDSGFRPDHWNPVAIMTVPFLLVLSGVCLLIPRSWSYAMAMLIAGSVLYANLYRSFAGISDAHGVPMLSMSAAQTWFEIMSAYQIINTGLAFVILAFGVAEFSRWLYRKMHYATTTRVGPTTIG